MNKNLFNLINMYCEEYSEIRKQNEDISNLAFHRGHGLQLRVPQEWKLLDIVAAVIKEYSSSAVTILYSETPCYQAAYEHLKDRDGITYLSWHEIYSAVHLSNSDVRHMRRVKQILGEADLVVALDLPALPGVEEQVQGHVNGCLLILSQGDRE